jgi:hypothetical protein
MSKPTIFIGSSTEGIPVALALQRRLEDEAETLFWSEGVFSLGEYPVDPLLRSLDAIDFAVLVVTTDDLVALRHGGATSPRENVAFELGLFMGRLGRSRVFVLMAEEGSSVLLPSNLAGITVARYRRPRDGNLLAAVGPACQHILLQIKAAGWGDHSARSTTPIDQYSCFISYSAQDKEFSERMYSDLQAVGIRCWLDSKDLKIGDNIELEIDRAIQLTDKVLLILSEASVNSTWVRYEVDNALRRESQAKKTILFPIRIDNAILKAGDEVSAALRRVKHIGDFTQWTVPDRYRQAFSRLVKDLTVSAAVEQQR